MEAKKVLITGNLEPMAMEMLKQKNYQIENFGPRSLLDEKDLIKSLIDKDAYILGGDERVTSSIIASTNSLKVISFLGTSPERFIDISTALSKKIFVAKTSGANTQAVAEMTLSLLLCARRNILFLNCQTHKGIWPTYQSQELQHHTLGIIGMGAIGQRVAEIAHFGFGMHIIYFSRKQKKEVEAKLGAKRVSLDELLQSSHMVSIHCSYDPRDPQTKGLIGSRELHLMSSDAILVNTASPHIVDGESLYEALQSRIIACAAFDGYYTEPHEPTRENDPFCLLQLPDTAFILTPHVAWRTLEADVRMSVIAAENVIKILK